MSVTAAAARIAKNRHTIDEWFCQSQNILAGSRLVVLPLQAELGLRTKTSLLLRGSSLCIHGCWVRSRQTFFCFFLGVSLLLLSLPHTTSWAKFAWPAPVDKMLFIFNIYYNIPALFNTSFMTERREEADLECFSSTSS